MHLPGPVPMRARAVTLAAALALAAVPARSPAQTAAARPQVAVLDFDAFSVSLEDAGAVGRGLAAMMTTELTERGGLGVVDRQRIAEILASQREGASGRIDDAAAVRLGELLGAHYVVTGSVVLERERARVDLRLLEVETGRVRKAVKRTGERDAFLALVEGVADEFTSGLELPTLARAEDLAVPPAASVAYSRGLAYERAGAADRAAAMYRRALELFPRHPAAREALGRVDRGGAAR